VGSTLIDSEVFSKALILLGRSIMPKTFAAAVFAFPRSGPYYYAYPAPTAPNIIENIAINTYSE